MEVQTRNHNGALQFFPTVKEAFDYASKHQDVWKVSFDLPGGERARFVRSDIDIDAWYCQDLMEAVKSHLGETTLSPLVQSMLERNGISDPGEELYEGGNTIFRHPDSYFE